MKPTAGRSPGEAGEAEPQPRDPIRRGFARRIECDGGGYHADSAGPARGGGMRDPSAGYVRRRAEPRG
jgi:hypothetical protein